MLLWGRVHSASYCPFSLRSRLSVQLISYLPAGGDGFGVGRVGHVHEADLVVLLILHAAGDRLVAVLEPMAADELRVAQRA